MASKAEAIFLSLISVLKSDITDYCDLETIDRNTLVANDGSLASILKFNGTKSIIGREQFEELVNKLTTSISIFFGTKGHQIQVVFRRDLDSKTSLEFEASKQLASASKLNLDVKDLIEENVATYSSYVYDEECYFVFWSRPQLLDQAEMKSSRDDINRFRAREKVPSMKNGQNLLRPISYLYDRHISFFTKICDDLSSPFFACSIDVLDVDEMLRAVRKSTYPNYTSTTWQPSIPGTKIPIRWKENNDHSDASEILYPSIPDQIMIGESESGESGTTLPDPTTLRVGNRVYAPLIFSIPPKNPETFNVLFDALNRAETIENGITRALPYSVSFMLESDAMNLLIFKSILSSILSIGSETNKNINLARAQLHEQRRDGEIIVKFRIAAMTWCELSNNQASILSLRKSKLMRTLSGWGDATIIERSGNPHLAFQTNAVGLTYKHIGLPAAAPLGDAIAMLPITRPASPFNQGSINFRSLDGKLLRYERFSSEQSTWISLFSGKPGSGKSVLMNNFNLESCILPGLTRLPYVCNIDVGVSSSGFIDLVKDNLPEKLKHLAIYKRLQNSERDCINPMDTPLGQKNPLPKERAFLVNFLSILATPAEREGKAYEGMSSFVGRVIDGVYKMKSDEFESSRPETYKRGHDVIVDEAVQKINMVTKTATTYWEIVDELFKNNLIYEAEVAQRYAVPTLNDLIAYASTKEIHDEYGGSMVQQGGMSIDMAFRLGIREAVNDYPLFNGHTKFDIGSARIMAIDLQDVAITGSHSAHKQTSLMYMIARQSFMKKVAFSSEDLPFFSSLYRPYYERLVNDIAEDYKVLCMDEYHKTGGHKILTQQVMTDGRESRKWLMEIMLASQLMSDFGELTDIATSYFILDSGTENTRKWLRDHIGLTPVEEAALSSYVNGPSAIGATALAKFDTKSSNYTQLLTMSIGPMRLWALSTTAEDRKLRTLMYQSLPGNEARKLLASKFPSGSCKKIVDGMKAKAFSKGEFVDEEMLDSVIDTLAKTLLNDYFKVRT